MALSTFLTNFISQNTDNHGDDITYVSSTPFKDVEVYDLNITNASNVDFKNFNPSKYISVLNLDTKQFNKNWLYYRRSANNLETSFPLKFYTESRDTLILNNINGRLE